MMTSIGWCLGGSDEELAVEKMLDLDIEKLEGLRVSLKESDDVENRGSEGGGGRPALRVVGKQALDLSQCEVSEWLSRNKGGRVSAPGEQHSQGW